MMPRLKDDFLNGGTNGRLYTDTRSDDQPYRVREIIFISRNRTGTVFSSLIVQYERGSAKLPLHDHLEDARLADGVAAELLREGKFADKDYHGTGM